MSPDRVTIISPSKGVRPMVVSIDRPWSMAHAEAPSPRWQVMIFSREKRFFRWVAAIKATYWCDVP